MRRVRSAFHRRRRLLANCRAPQQDLAYQVPLLLPCPRPRCYYSLDFPFQEDVEPHHAFWASFGEHTRGGGERREGLEAALDSGVWSAPTIQAEGLFQRREFEGRREAGLPDEPRSRSVDIYRCFCEAGRRPWNRC